MSNFDGRASIFHGSDWVTDLQLCQKIVELVAGCRPKTLLDLGIGTGIVESYLASTIAVTGIDQSKAMLDECRKQLPGAELIFGDIRNLTDILRGRRFDAVFSRATLGHMRIFPIIKSVRDFLSPNGSVILCESVAYSPSDVARQIEFHNLIHPGHIDFPAPKQLLEKFGRLGYQIPFKKRLYTDCSLNSLFSSTRLSAKEKLNLRDFLRSSVSEDWHVRYTRNGDCIYRRPWLLLRACV